MNAEHIWTILLLAEILGARDVFDEAVRQLERCLKLDDSISSSLSSSRNTFLAKCFPIESEHVLQKLLKDLTLYFHRFPDNRARIDALVFETPPRASRGFANQSETVTPESRHPLQPASVDRRSRSPLAVSWEQMQLQYLRTKGVSEESTSRILSGGQAMNHSSFSMTSHQQQPAITSSSSSKRSAWTQTPPSPSYSPSSPSFRYSTYDEDDDDVLDAARYRRSYSSSHGYSNLSDFQHGSNERQPARHRGRYSHDDVFDEDIYINRAEDIRQRPSHPRGHHDNGAEYHIAREMSRESANPIEKSSLRSSYESIDTNLSSSSAQLRLSNEAANQIVQSALVDPTQTYYRSVTLRTFYIL
jgi:hypothetical protein